MAGACRRAERQPLPSRRAAPRPSCLGGRGDVVQHLAGACVRRVWGPRQGVVRVPCASHGRARRSNACPLARASTNRRCASGAWVAGPPDGEGDVRGRAMALHEGAPPPLPHRSLAVAVAVAAAGSYRRAPSHLPLRVARHAGGAIRGIRSIFDVLGAARTGRDRWAPPAQRRPVMAECTGGAGRLAPIWAATYDSLGRPLTLGPVRRTLVGTTGARHAREETGGRA